MSARDESGDPCGDCSRCGRPAQGRASYRLAGGGGEEWLCLVCALRHRGLVRRSAVVALVVGTLLNLINQGDALLGAEGAPNPWKIALTYLVPYAVATYGALGNARARSCGTPRSR